MNSIDTCMNNNKNKQINEYDDNQKQMPWWMSVTLHGNRKRTEHEMTWHGEGERASIASEMK